VTLRYLGRAMATKICSKCRRLKQIIAFCHLSSHSAVPVDDCLSSSARRFGVKAAPVPLRSLSSPPASAVFLTPSLMPRAPATTKAVDQEEGAMALLEKEVTRFAESLDDYEHVSVKDIGGWAPHGFCTSLASRNRT